jgi:hypothetical protein
MMSVYDPKKEHEVYLRWRRRHPKEPYNPSDPKFYFTGKPCKRGHICNRWLNDHTCYECKLAQTRYRRSVDGLFDNLNTTIAAAKKYNHQRCINSAADQLRKLRSL